jgi:hypothetical protein
MQEKRQAGILKNRQYFARVLGFDQPRNWLPANEWPVAGANLPVVC